MWLSFYFVLLGGLLSLLYLQLSVFQQLKKFQHYFFKFFFATFLFFLWHQFTHILYHLILSQLQLSASLFLVNFFSLCSSDWIISIYWSSSSLTFCFRSPVCCWPTSKIFISGTLLSSRIYIEIFLYFPFICWNFPPFNYYEYLF